MFLFYFTKASSLKCYTGNTTAKAETTCADALDVCVKYNTTAGVVNATCELQATAIASFSTGHAGANGTDSIPICNKPDNSNITTCLCKADLCNTYTVTTTTESSASTQSAFQLSAMIAAFCLIKLLMTQPKVR